MAIKEINVVGNRYTEGAEGKVTKKAIISMKKAEGGVAGRGNVGIVQEAVKAQRRAVRLSACWALWLGQGRRWLKQRQWPGIHKVE